MFHWQSDDIPSEIHSELLVAIEKRKDEIKHAMLNRMIAKKLPMLLKEFDFQTKAILSSSSFSKVDDTLMNLDLGLSSNGISTTDVISLELDHEELQKFINSLELLKDQLN